MNHDSTRVMLTNLEARYDQLKNNVFIMKFNMKSSNKALFLDRMRGLIIIKFPIYLKLKAPSSALLITRYILRLRQAAQKH